jgi:hypothetical protein
MITEEGKRLKERFDSAYIDEDGYIILDYPDWDTIALENAKLRQALQFIRDNYGKVCDNYELCDCRSCESSYGAWATADMTLKELEEKPSPVPLSRGGGG